MSELFTVSPLYTRCYETTPQWTTLDDSLADGVVESCLIQDQTVCDGDFSNIRFRRVVFQNCRLLNCSFEDSELLESRFIGCDLSGSRFDGSVWQETISWLSTGFRIRNAVLTNAVFEDCGISMEDLSDCTAESVEIYKGAL